jgi:hypothetical protein
VATDGLVTGEQAALASSGSAVEAERRRLLVLKSQEAQLAADLRAKVANLVVAQVNLGYTKISAVACARALRMDPFGLCIARHG